MKIARALGVLLSLALMAPACGEAGEPTGSGGETSSTGGDGGNGGAGGEAGSGAGGTAGAGPSRVVWVGAHPDDELYAAPWLGALCIEEAASCTFVVMTRGEAGNCKLPEGCSPNLAAVRDSELAQSAAFFGADLVHWDFGDGTSSDVLTVANTWVDAAGGPEKLLADLIAIFEGADIVITFDPRHGDSCHPDHRAAGAIALAVAEQMGVSAPPITLVASKGILEPAAPGDPSVWAFDASAPSQKLGADYWSALIHVLNTHKSQFTPDEVATVEAVPPESRKTFLLSAADAIEDDPLYAGLCQ